jgi:endonuclease/exonuclease/phosphatase family metal-dependent hydrolase
MTARRLGCLIVFVLFVALVIRRCRADDLRVGTYNIRELGVAQTDLDALTDVVRRAKVDVLAVQEIQSEPKLRELARRLSDDQRSMEVALSRCGGSGKMHVGFLYDVRRVKLLETREYPELDPGGKEACGGDRPGLVARFERMEPEGRRFELLVFHLAAGSEPARVATRKEQWRRAHRIAKLARDPIAILGDANSTGYLDDREGERTFIDKEAANANMEVVTAPLKCSEYFQPEPPAIRPSLLDHVVAAPDLVRPGSMAVHGYCAELACRPADSPPREFTHVSDHCPVTFDLR